MNYNHQHQVENQAQLENQDQLENQEQLEYQDQLENQDQQEYRGLTPDQNPQSNQMGITETCNMFCKTDGPFGRNVKDAVYEPLTEFKESINNKFEEVESTLVNLRYDIQKLSPIDTTSDSGNKLKLEKLIGDVLNISNNVQTSVTTGNKELNALKQDLSALNKLNLEETSNLKEIINQLAIIANKLNDPSFTENTLLKSIENIINNKLNAMENNLKIDIDEKFKSLENNQNKSMKEFIDTALLDKITNVAKEICDNKTAANKDNEILPSIAKINNELKNISQNMGNINNLGQNIESSTPSTNPTTLETQPNCIGRTCNIQVPSSVKIGNNIWQSEQIPVEDELDKYMSSLTGCRYYGLQHERYFHISPIQVPFQGTFEWRGAVRARDAAYVGIWWPSSPGYGFPIGQDNNENTVMYQWKPWTELTRQSSTGILLDDRYIPFCIKIQNGLLSIGKQCDDNHIISRNIAINIGEIIRMSL